MKTFVCTCGTSIATKRGINLDRFERRPISEWNEAEDEINSILHTIAEKMEHITLPNRIDDTSAEIKSLYKMGLVREDRVILITSDTLDGKICANAVRDFMIEQKMSLKDRLDIKPIEGLQAEDGKRFLKKGLKNLLNFLLKFEHDGNVIFNSTGGYKSVAPYISIVGMLFNKPVRYIHENSEQVLEIAGLPLLLDENLMFKIESKLQKMENETSISIAEWREGIDYHDHRFDSFVEEVADDQVTLSGIGFLLWERFRKDYPQELERDLRSASEKENKLEAQGTTHHGNERIRPIAKKLLESVFVKGVPNSCDNQNKSRVHVKVLSRVEAKIHLKREADGICMVTDVRTDAGYSFLIQTTARNHNENQQIVEILKQKYF